RAAAVRTALVRMAGVRRAGVSALRATISAVAGGGAFGFALLVTVAQAPPGLVPAAGQVAVHHHPRRGQPVDRGDAGHLAGLAFPDDLPFRTALTALPAEAGRTAPRVSVRVVGRRATGRCAAHR